MAEPAAAVRPVTRPSPGPRAFGYGYELSAKRGGPYQLLLWASVALVGGIALYSTFSGLLSDIPGLLASSPVPTDPCTLARKLIAQEADALRAQMSEQAQRHEEAAARQTDAWEEVTKLEQEFKAFAQELRAIEGRVLGLSRSGDERSDAVTEVMRAQAALRDTQQWWRTEVGSLRAQLQNATASAEAAALQRSKRKEAVQKAPASDHAVAELEASLGELGIQEEDNAAAVATLESALEDLRAQLGDTVTHDELRQFEAALDERRAAAAAATARSTAHLGTNGPLDATAIDKMVQNALRAHGLSAYGEAAAAAAAAAASASRSGGGGHQSSSCVGEADVKRLIEAELAAFVADRTGRRDHAAAVNGGRVVRARGLTSASYTPPSNRLPADVWHKLGREAGAGGPEEAISRDAGPASCFAMAGSGGGQLTVALAKPVEVDAVSLQHLSRLVALDMSSAPRDFEVFGVTSLEDEKPALLARGSFDAAGPDVQTFPVAVEGEGRQQQRRFSLVTLRVLSNHGNQDYTCLYRFRVHGS